MTDPEVRQALQQMHDARQGLERLTDQHAANMAKVLVALAELTEQRILIDQLIAWVHGADMLPKLTPGAQAIKAKKGTTSDPF